MALLGSAVLAVALESLLPSAESDECNDMIVTAHYKHARSLQPERYGPLAKNRVIENDEFKLDLVIET